MSLKVPKLRNVPFEALWGTWVSPDTVSNLNKKIYAQIEAWRNEPIGKTLSQVTKRLVCRDHHGPSFIARADEFEQHAGLGLVLGRRM